ncbi:MAG: PKD domain-containing protein [Bacteroidales bacterium]|nr:PKD domain-containing protein [Bacteroidales bacterium]
MSYTEELSNISTILNNISATINVGEITNIYSSNQDVTVSNSSFLCAGNNFSLHDGNLKIINCSFKNNISTIITKYNFGSVIIDNSEFIGSYGTIDCLYSNIFVKNTVFKDCALSFNIPEVETAKFIDCKISKHKSAFVSNCDAKDKLLFENCHFDSVSFDAGPLIYSYCKTSVSNCSLTNSVIGSFINFNNTNDDADFDVFNSTFKSNKVLTEFFYVNGKSKIVNCDFEYNDFFEYVIQSYGVCHLNGVRISNNKIIKSIIYAASTPYRDINSLMFENSEFLNNVDSNYLFETYTDVYFLNSKIENNFSTNYILFSPSSFEYQIFNTSIINNKTIAENFLLVPDAYILNSIFAKNESLLASEFLGSQGMYTASFKKIENSVFYGNKMKGRFCNSYNGYTPNNITNSIIWDNQMSEGTIAEKNDKAVQFSNIQFVVPGEGNMNVDPLFVDAANNNFSLSCESPLINKGKNEFVTSTTDFQGNARITAGVVDMGAIESIYNPELTGKPEPDFFPTILSPCVGEPVYFFNTTPNTDANKYFWTFGDGSTPQYTANGEHVYAQSGEYEVKLIAENICGLSGVVTKNIIVNTKQKPKIETISSVHPNSIVSYKATDGCGIYNWSVSGGEIVSGQGSSSISVQWGSGIDGDGSVALQVADCNDVICELFVQEIVPILPENFYIVGANVACFDSVSTYRISHTGAASTSFYEWSVTGGKVIGASNGYGLYTVDVQWANLSSFGEIKLTVKTEYYTKSESTSLQVELKEPIKFPNTFFACAGTTDDNFSLNIKNYDSNNFIWTVAGTENSVSPDGLVNWGSQGGLFEVKAVAIDFTSYCVSENARIVEVIELPKLEQIDGVFRVKPLEEYTYRLKTDKPDNVISWVPSYGSVRNANADSAVIVWQETEYDLDLTIYAVAKNNCYEIFTFPVEKDYIPVISGNESPCYLSTEVYSINKYKDNNLVYSWYLDGVLLPETDSFASVTFNEYGSHQLIVETVFDGKTYRATRNLYTNTAASNASINGPLFVDPEGLGEYIYTVLPTGDPYTVYTQGAADYKLIDNKLYVTWGGQEPFSVSLLPAPAGEACVAKQRTLTVKKVDFLNDPISHISGNTCINNSATYSFTKDTYTSNPIWAVSGGIITQQTETQVTVLWGAVPGTYTLTAKYERFGSRRANYDVTVYDNPKPEITDVTICGFASERISTTENYSSYIWSREPDGNQISDVKSFEVNKEGIYKVSVANQFGCKGVTAKFIKQVPLPPADIFKDSDVMFCQGAGTKTVSLKTIEGAHLDYVWYKNGVEIPQSNSQFLSFQFDANVVKTDHYKVKIHLLGCEVTSPTTIVTSFNCNGGTITGGDGDGDGWVDTVIPCTDPDVSFNLDGCNPIQLTNTSAGSSGFYWYFGDGQMSTLTNPDAHSYSRLGDYYVNLKKGCKSASKNITIPALALTRLKTPACAGTELEFIDYSVNIPGYNIVEWNWDFGDGSTVVVNNDIAKRDIKHIFATPGVYYVKLTITAEGKDKQLCMSSETITVLVTAPPVVDFDISYPSCDDNLFVFTSSSQIATQEALFSWNLDENYTAKTVNAAVRYSEQGEKTVQLQVKDLWECTTTVSKSLTFASPIIAQPIAVGGSTLLCNSLPVTLTAPESTNGYLWTRNGEPISESEREISASIPGDYIVHIQIDGCTTKTDTVQLTLFNSGATLSGVQFACENQYLKFEVENIDASKYSINWLKDGEAFGTGGSSLIFENVALGDKGTYSAVVEKKDDGCSERLQDIVMNVGSKPAIPITRANLIQICKGDSVYFITNSIPEGLSIDWFQNGIKTGVTDTAPTFKDIQIATTFELQLTDISSGCTSLSAPVSIKIPLIEEFKLGDDKVACAGAEIKISNGINQSLLSDSQLKVSNDWYKDGSLFLSSGGNELIIDNFDTLYQGNYQVLVTLSQSYPNCKFYSDEINLTLLPSPRRPQIIGKDDFCEGETVYLSSSVKDNITWHNGLSEPDILVTTSGNYVVTALEPSTGCKLSTVKNVIINKNPDFSFLPKGYYEECFKDTVVFEGLQNFKTYQWFYDGEPYREENQDLWVAREGDYVLKATSKGGCSAGSGVLHLKPLNCYNTCVVSTTEDYVVGSLREAINCSNSSKGKDKIDFMLPVLEAPYKFLLNGPLPEITDAVIIDATTQPGNENGDLIAISGDWYNETVFSIAHGVNDVTIKGFVIDKFQQPISIRTGAAVISIEKNNFVNFNRSAIYLQSATSYIDVRNNIFSGNTGSVGLSLEEKSSVKVVENRFQTVGTACRALGSLRSLQFNNNIVAQSFNTAIEIQTYTDNFTALGNTFYHIGGSAINIAQSKNITISNNVFGFSDSDVVGNGVEINTAQNIVIYNNKFTHCRNGIISRKPATIQLNTFNSCREYGVWIDNNSTLLSNEFVNCAFGGVYVQNNGVNISSNLFMNDIAPVKGIDLHNAANFNKQCAAFSDYYRSQGTLIMSGTAMPGDKVEIFKNNGIPQHALSYIGTTYANNMGAWQIAIPEGTGFDPNTRNYYVNTATSFGNTSELSEPFQVGCFNCICTVTNTTDADPESFRDALSRAHQGECLRIEFNLQPLAEIQLESELPSITVPLTIACTLV